MKMFKITYRESRDSETQTCNYRGHDSEHAMERFWDSMIEEGGCSGLEILSAVKVKNNITRLASAESYLRSRSR